MPERGMTTNRAQRPCLRGVWTWATTSTPTVLLPLHRMCFYPSVRNSGRIHVSTLYPTTMLVHMISFISVIAVMIYFVLIQIKSHSNLLTYSTGATSPTATPVSWTAWSMPPRSPSSTAMSARCRFVARRRTSCITSRRRAAITTGPWRRTSSTRRATRSPC